MSNEFGDYQTPLALAQRVIEVIKSDKIQYTHMVEPTFGDGHFIISAMKHMPSITSISGFELQQEHFENTVTNVDPDTGVNLNLQCKDIFSGEIQSLFSSSESNIVLGNLPWVTVSQLSALESKNIPKKTNIKGLRGFDALTGKSNFDIAEYISLLLMHELSQLGKPSTLAVLVKNIVAQNILRYLPSSNLRPTSMAVYEFNAKKEFNVSADAGLMVIRFGEKNSAMKDQFTADVYDLEHPENIKSRFGWVNNKFVSNVDQYTSSEMIDHVCDWDWRSGVKHDAGKVMELSPKSGAFTNGLGETVTLEPNLIYPLVKSSDIRKQDIHSEFRKYLLLPQNQMGQDTSYIKEKYPLTWTYLKDHLSYFANRKSSIYKNKDQFAVFGIGKYSFAKYKVAVSGMYKIPKFSILPSLAGKPVMGDDTVYFLGFSRESDAVICAAVLNSRKVQDLLSSLVFISSKRPYTKDILKRIDIVAALNELSLSELQESAYREISSGQLNDFLNRYQKVDSLF